MEVLLEDIPCRATIWEVKKAIAEVLHGPVFFDPGRQSRKANFRVELEESRNGLPSNGKGKLVLSDRLLGERFFKWACYRENPGIVVFGRKLWIKQSSQRPKRSDLQFLRRTPYMDAEVEQKREETLSRVGQVRIILDAVQFGVFYRKTSDLSTVDRSFSIEFEFQNPDTFAGELSFDYEHKLFRIESGNCISDDTIRQVVIDLANVKKAAYGKDAAGKYYICWELWHSPRFEQQPRYLRTSKDKGEKYNSKKFRERLPHLGGLHEFVGPYAHQIRLVLNDPHARRDLKFLCEEAGIRAPHRAQIQAQPCEFFHPSRLAEARSWMLDFAWPVRFQLEALLRSGLIHTRDLFELSAPIEDLVRTRPMLAPDILRRFSEKVQAKSGGETVLSCFRAHVESEIDNADALSEEASDRSLTSGSMPCAHVIVTPTRILLEGPYDTQSNRIVRKYHGYRDHFVRVEFRDENRLVFRWPKEVDGRSLIEQRFGGILKEGLEIGGRRFRFLGYSNSGLREHTSWFMADFDHPTEGHVTAEKVRGDLGDFSSCIRIPSKFAARIAQAFSGTDRSVRITREQWDVINDLGEEPYLHTDGQGTISPGLRDRIWEVLVEDSPEKAKLLLVPSAFQIRFLGFKGVVVVDETLEGICMRLRPSMKKYEAQNENEAEIEIAKAFSYPQPARLCRPLIAVLEDRGVEQKAFLDLQSTAMKEVITATDHMKDIVELLRKHGLGNVFGLRWTLARLEEAGVGLRREMSQAKFPMDNDFIKRLFKYAQTHILHEIKHDARIKIEKAHQLVGVVDEGPAYVAAGYGDVYCLPEGHIYACIQHPEQDQMEWIQGSVSISRSPHIHPGDVQRVWAIGKPPEGKLCFFRNLKNVVVMPSTGKRSLASCLAGGDVDGDEYLVIKDESLLPKRHADPAEYEGVDPKKLDRDSTIDDICDFFVEYMQSDIVGLLSDQHLIIGDQSKDGCFDSRCMTLAQLCSQAVDYPKNGVPVKFEDMPGKLFYAKPDWKKSEDRDPRPTDYYESARALGVLFRTVEIKDLHAPAELYPSGEPLRATSDVPLSDQLSAALRPEIEYRLHRFQNSEEDVTALEPLFRHYSRELAYICLTHAPADNADVRLAEEEVVVGTILAKSADRRWRKSRMHRMREHTAQLVRDVKYRRRGLGMPTKKQSSNGRAGRENADSTEKPALEEFVAALARGWAAWDFGMRYRDSFGARSFGLIGLGVVCEMLQKLGELDSSED